MIGPILILICSYVVPDYMRQFIAFIIQSVIIFLGHLFFLVLIRPTPDNKMFPYHVKTNQIISNDTASGSYPHHDEDKGGNKNFNNMSSNLSNLFLIKNNGEKYQIDSLEVIDFFIFFLIFNKRFKEIMFFKTNETRNI